MTNEPNKARDVEVFHHPYEISENIGNLKLSIFHNDLSEEASMRLWKTNWHFHSSCEIIALVKGTETVTADRDYLMKSGDVLIIPNKLNHKCQPVDSYQQRVSLLITVTARKNDVKPQSFEARVITLINDFINRAQGPIQLSGRAELVDYAEKAVKMARSGSLISYNAFKYHLVLFVLQTLDAIGDNFGAELPESDNDLQNASYESAGVRNQMIERYLYDNYCKNVTIKGLADHIHLSERQTSRILLEYFGATFKQIVNQNRIRTAQTMLLEGVPINTVAENVGFQSINGFNKAFKNVTGITPYQFTRDNRDQIKIPAESDAPRDTKDDEAF